MKIIATGLALSISNYVIIQLDLVALVSKMHGTIGRMLFAVVCRIIADQYLVIENEIKQMANEAINDNCCSKFTIRLRRLQHKYDLVCRCADQLNSCFELLLLFDIIYIFICFTNMAMYSVESFLILTQWQYMLLTIVMLISEIISLAVICCSGHRLSFRVSLNSYLFYFCVYCLKMIVRLG